MLAPWEEELTIAARNAKAAFESVELVTNEAHGRTAIGLLRAFGGDENTTMLAESRTPDRLDEENARPADVLILHPRLGAFFVEVKGWVIGEITRINAGTIFRHVGGSERSHNPWKQAQDAAGQLSDATKRVVESRRLIKREVPYFDWIVALPNISTAEWAARGFDKTLNRSEILFSDDLSDHGSLHDRLINYISAKAAKAGKTLPFTRDQLDHVREALGSSVVINARRSRRVLTVSDTLGYKIDKLELAHKRLSPEQMDLIAAEFDGRPQLVRGVAGSGKSVVLIKNLVNLVDRTFNTAQLSFQNATPSKRFLVACYNRSLVPFLRANFDASYRELTHQEPPDCVHVYNLNRLQYELSTLRSGPLEYQRWGSQQNMNEQFAVNYSAQLDRLAQANPGCLEAIQYDAIYVDEGQDLFEEEFVFLMKLLRTDPKTGLKNIVIFYDDAQNLYGRPRPTWSKLGIDIAGRSRVMKACFRNTKQIVEFAFNLLLGARAETRVRTKGFADVETLKENGLVRELPDRWQVNFAERPGELPAVSLFGSREQEKSWIETTVRRLITQEGVRPGDILLVSEEPREFESAAEALKESCKSIHRVIKPYGRIHNPDKDEYIFGDGCLTLATVEAAKGYDSPIVFLMGTDLFRETTEGRARFYVGATRAKVQLYVTGLRGRGGLAGEAEAVSKLLATNELAYETPSPISNRVRNTPSLRPNGAGSIGTVPRRAEIAPTPTRPPVVTPSVLQVFAPRFHRGDTVQHPNYGIGMVVQDGIRKRLSSQGQWDEDVRVQFGGTIKKLEAGSAGLVVVQQGGTS